MTSSKKFTLMLSICTFGLLAPYLVSFRAEKSTEADFDSVQKRNEMMNVNESEEENQVLLPKITKRYILNSLSMLQR